MIKRKISMVIAIILMSCFTMFSFAGCSIVDILDTSVELDELKQQNQELLDENNTLKQELATLRFEVDFPTGIVDRDIIMNSVNRSIIDYTEGDCLQVIGSAQVTINGGDFYGGQTPLGGAGNTAVWCNSEDAKITINGGKFTIKGLAEGDTGHIDLIYCTAGTIEINGGYFEGADDTVWLLNCKDTNYAKDKANIIVKGGEFVNWNPADCISEGEHTNFVAEGYTVTEQVFNQGTEQEYTLYIVVESAN